MQCNHRVEIVIHLSNGGVLSDAPCPNEVKQWRQCGNDCRLEIAYCDEHGGDERAAREMAEHNLMMHVPAVMFP